MLECIFTLDYEIYGNGEGSLRELVYEPAERLKAVFDRYGAKFVAFVEAAELEKIDAFRTDPAIDVVKSQIRAFYQEGFEIALHLHPQWYNAQYENNKWKLDYTEYNLCTLSEPRITEIVERSIRYLQRVLNAPNFTPHSFRAGNWLFQPTAAAARVLARHDVKIDSSVFKGGRLHQHGVDYRRAIKNGQYWMFRDDVAIPDPAGIMLEIPIYTEMVPFWKMFTAKRIGLQQKAASRRPALSQRLGRLVDLLRPRQPLKFDFCRMTLPELVTMIEGIIKDDQRGNEVQPMVAIGHTKDLIDFTTIEALLSYLKKENIAITTLEQVYDKCLPHAPCRATVPRF